jgi:hypothetical protein
VSADGVPTPAARARGLLTDQNRPGGLGDPAARAAAWATLALVEAVDRQTAVLGRLTDALSPPDPADKLVTDGPPPGWAPPGQRCTCYGHAHVRQPDRANCGAYGCACPGLPVGL